MSTSEETPMNSISRHLPAHEPPRRIPCTPTLVAVGAGLVLASPLIFAFVVLWTTLGFLLINTNRLGIIGPAAVWLAFFLGSPSDANGLDVAVLTTVFSILCVVATLKSSSRRQAAWPAGPVRIDPATIYGKTWHYQPVPIQAVAAVAVSVYVIVTAAVGPIVGTSPAAVTTTSLITVWFLVLSAMRIWRPSSYAQLEAAEAWLLSHAKVPVSVSRIARLSTVKVDDAVCGTAPMPAGSPPGSKRPALVILHGFGAGSAMQWSILEHLAPYFSAVYCLDWLGVGRSVRPDFPYNKPVKAEQWFVDALEEWRMSVGLREFVLMGHSLGAIIATAYSVAHPSHVKHLVLASPAHGPERLFQPDQVSRFFKFAAFWWKRGVTPMAGVRWLGPLGPPIIRRGLAFRYARSSISDSEKAALGAYTYHHWIRRPSGEMSLSTLLVPGARSRLPMEPRLDFSVIQAPLSVLYGAERDWMDKSFGRRVAKSYRRQGGHSTFSVVPNASHQLFIDQPRVAAMSVVGAVCHSDVADAADDLGVKFEDVELMEVGGAGSGGGGNGGNVGNGGGGGGGSDQEAKHDAGSDGSTQPLRPAVMSSSYGSRRRTGD